MATLFEAAIKQDYEQYKKKLALLKNEMEKIEKKGTSKKTDK